VFADMERNRGRVLQVFFPQHDLRAPSGFWYTIRDSTFIHTRATKKMIKTCATCNKPHVPPSNSRAHNCLACWKLAQGYELTKSDEAHQRLADVTHTLMTNVDTLTAQLTAAREQIKHLHAQPQTPQGIPKDLLMSLIFLCHPDRHGGSEAALTATKALIAMRTPK
jgi:hypothetical protein